MLLVVNGASRRGVAQVTCEHDDPRRNDPVANGALSAAFSNEACCDSLRRADDGREDGSGGLSPLTHQEHQDTPTPLLHWLLLYSS